MCRTVSVDDHDYRYTVVHAGKKDKPLALLDTGGPGGALFGGAWPGQALKRLTPRYDVLLIEEPWVLTQEPEGCPEALTGWYRAVHDHAVSATQPAAAAVAKSCRLWQDQWGWSPQRYVDVVSAALADTGRELDSFVGFSFASTRLAYLRTAGFAFRTVDLVSPFPVGAAIDDYVDAREQVLDTQPSFDQSLVGAQPDGRSLPVSAADLEAAQLQAQYTTAGVRARIHQHADAELVGRMSDMLLGRYGVDSIAPSLLAFWDETCPALVDTRTGTTQPRGVLQELVAVCAEAEGSDVTETTALASTDPPPCVVVSGEDGVVPIRLVRSWAESRRWPLTVREGPHADIRYLDACLE